MWLYRLTRVALRAAGPFYCRLRVVGDLGEIPAEGPLIVTANHGSFLDPWFIGAAFPRPVSYLISDRWFHRSAAWRWFFRANGGLPIRSEPRRTIEDLVAHLRRGRVIGIFPEGRVSQDGSIGRFKSGFARAAALSGAPVVPVGLRGNYEILPRQRRLPRPGTVEIHVGRPMLFGARPRGQDGRQDVLGFRDRVFAEVCRLAGRVPSVQSGRKVVPAAVAPASSRAGLASRRLPFGVEARSSRQRRGR